MSCAANLIHKYTLFLLPTELLYDMDPLGNGVDIEWKNHSLGSKLIGLKELAFLRTVT